MYFDNPNNTSVIDKLNALYDLVNGGVGSECCQASYAELQPELAGLVTLPDNPELNEGFFHALKELL